MEEVPNETYHGHGFNTFKQAHGIHYDETQEKEPVYADDTYQTEFHAAHGLHYGELDDAERTEISESREQRIDQLFSSMDDVKRGVIMAEILGKPKGLR